MVALYLKLQGEINPHGWHSKECTRPMGVEKKYAVIGEGVDMDGDGDGVEYAVTGKDYGYGQ
jgi:hypothetical protein